MSEFGDEEFKEFLDNQDNNSEAGFVLNTIKSKMYSVMKLYSETLKSYKEIGENDPLRDDLAEFIRLLMKESKQSFTQYDYALLIEDDDDEGNKDE